METTFAMDNPWQEMRRLQREMERLFADLTPGWRWPLTGEYPPVNITRTGTAIIVDALCPGVPRGSLDITVVGDAVTLRGERTAEAGLDETRCQRRERPLGPFTRTLALGERLDPDATRASYTNGLVRIELARAPEAAPKKITIQS
jgi:HSP20 family protein